MTESSDDTDGATADDETPHGASEPDGFDDREEESEESDENEESEIPPEARDKEEDRYRDKHEKGRETANPDQHRDEEAYD